MSAPAPTAAPATTAAAAATAPATAAKANPDKKKKKKAAKKKPADKDKKDPKKAEEEEEEEEEDEESKKEEKAEDLTNPDVVLKYRLAGEIANNAVALVLKNAAAGKKIVDLCEQSDAFIRAETDKIYKTGKVEKGVGFPTCLSVNHFVGHVAPAKDDTAVLKAGDVVKVDLGVHVDGYVAVVAHTFVVPADPAAAPLAGRGADVIAAANTAAEAVLRLMKVGTKNTLITETIGKVASQYKVSLVQGVLSHNLKRYVIDGPKVIINRPDVEHKVDEFEIEANEVYAIEIVFSTGEGKPKEQGSESTTVFKRNISTTYQLKLDHSRNLFNDIQKNAPYFPFTTRLFESKARTAIGVREMLQHDLLHAYPILLEKPGDIVAQFKFTLLIQPAGAVKVAGVPADLSKLAPTQKVDDAELKALLAQSAPSKDAAKKAKKNAKKKEKKAAAGGAAPAAAAAAPAATPKA